MRKAVAVMFASIWLVACSQQPAQEPGQVEDQASASDAMEASEPADMVPATTSGSVVVQGGVLVFPFPFSVSLDRVALTSTGRDQRQLRLIVESADPIELVLQKAADQVEAIGYKSSPFTTGDDGGLRQSFKKDGVHDLRIILRPGEAVAPENPASSYSLYITETAPAVEESAAK